MAARTEAARHRRFVLRAILRPLLITIGYLVVYFVIPIRGPFGVVSACVLVVCLAALGVLIVWQVRRIAVSDHPRLRAVDALATTVPLFLLAFASAYHASAAGAFNVRLTRVDALYFAVTVFATVGFGDIVPLAQWARVLVTVQIVGDLIVLGLVARVLVEAVRRGLARLEDQ